MITNSLPEALAIAAVSFAAGVIAGQFVRFRREEAGDRTKLRWELDRRPFDGRWFRVTVVALFIAATAIIVQFTVTQRGCNAEFQRTISERAEANAADSRARKENDQAVADLVRGLLVINPGPVSGDQSRALLERFDDTVTDNQRRQQENENKRAANPYPRC